MEKSRKYATLVVRALLGAWKTKNRGTAIVERIEFCFALCLWNNQGISMQTKFLRHSTELGNLAHCCTNPRWKSEKLGFKSRQKKPTSTSNKLVNKVMGVKSARCSI